METLQKFGAFTLKTLCLALFLAAPVLILRDCSNHERMTREHQDRMAHEVREFNRVVREGRAQLIWQQARIAQIERERARR
jgi:hypothetical protein